MKFTQITSVIINVDSATFKVNVEPQCDVCGEILARGTVAAEPEPLGDGLYWEGKLQFDLTHDCPGRCVQPEVETQMRRIVVGPPPPGHRMVSPDAVGELIARTDADGKVVLDPDLARRLIGTKTH